MTQHEHPVFRAPGNHDIKIWRYMDFTKLVSLLEEEGLFFSRADFFDDPFEGSIPHTNVKTRPNLFHGLPPERVALTIESTSRFIEWQRRWIMINCWHMNEHESAAMWRLYARTNEAVCVQSTYDRLRKSLPKEVLIGEVQYIDYKSETLPEGNVLYPYVYKRKSFEHERELRAVITKWPLTDEGFDFNAEPAEGGVLEKVDLSQLIEAVYVAPSSPSWFYKLVKKILVRYGLNKPVIQSSLDDKPVY